MKIIQRYLGALARLTLSPRARAEEGEEAGVESQ